MEPRLPEDDRGVDLRARGHEHRQALAAHQVDPVDVVRVVPPVERRGRGHAAVDNRGFAAGVVVRLEPSARVRALEGVERGPDVEPAEAAE
jgi:hypothetical protein